MNNLKKYELGLPGLEYVKEMIPQEGVWGKSFQNLCNLDKGRAITYLPEGIDQKRLEEFKSGGKLPRNLKDRIRRKQSDGTEVVMEPKSNLDEFFSTIIDTSLQENKNRICIFEDTLARAADPFLEKLKTPHWSYVDRIFHYIAGSMKNNFSALDVLNSANNAYLTWSAITTQKGEEGLVEGARELNENDLNNFAKRAEKIIVSAYDGESYVVWEKI